MFWKKKRDTEILEINYKKENKVMQELFKISYNTKDFKKATADIVQIMLKYYSIDFFSIFLYDGRLKISSTNVAKNYLSDLEHFINDIYVSKFSDSAEVDAYVLKSEQPINYPTGFERGIKYIMFIPLRINETVGAVLIENNRVSITQDEVEFFELIANNIALIIQNFMYLKKILDSANLDGLTRIYNRRYLNEHLSNEMEAARRTGKIVSACIFDIDHFKNFNDSYGHLHGDKVLIEVSKYVQSAIGSYDVLYRYGGEEFVIYMPEQSLQDAVREADTIRRGIENLAIYTDRNEITKVTASFGVASFQGENIDLKEWIGRADKAMYLSKQTGRNRVLSYEDVLKAE